MRGFVGVVAVLIAMAMVVVPMGPPAQAVVPGVRVSEIYRAQIPLSKRSRAFISVEHFTRAGPGTSPAEAHSFYGCLRVEGAPRKNSSTYYYPYRPTFSNCSYLDVMRYEADPQLRRMVLKFDMPQPTYYGQPPLPPASVTLKITGRGPMRDRTPAAGVYTYGPSVWAWAGSYSSRRARSRGTIIAPGVGKRTVRKHSARRGVLERRTQVGPGTDSHPYYPYYP